MNADRLIALYERVANAPDATSRLRSFVLDLAVRGKLAEQVSADVSAAKLLYEIGIARKRLGLKSSGMSPEIGETPFSLPSGWGWTRLGDICIKTGSGSTPRGGKDVYKETGIPFLRSQNIYNDGLRLDDVVYIDAQTHDNMKATSVVAGDLLLNITGGSMGRCARVPSGFAGANISQHVAIIRPAVEGLDTFLHHLILSPYFQAYIFDEQTGAGRGGLPKNRMDQIVVALPPLAEQRRIVAKVDELIVLLDRLEATRQKREATRDSLAAATLARLAASDTPVEDAITHSRFALNALPALTTRPDRIKALRQTILSLAVTGKLEQAPSGAIEAVGKFRQLQNGYAFKSEWFKESGVRLLRNTNIGHGQIFWNDAVSLPVNKIAEYERFMLSEGDIVLTLDRPFIVTGTKVARVTKADLPSLLLQRVGRFTTTAEGLCDDYLYTWIISPSFNEQVDPGRSNGVPHISSKQVEAAQIYVPSLQEQRRVVAKVGALLSLCDQLETAQTRADITRSRLLETLLHEALTPDTDLALEAAE